MNQSIPVAGTTQQKKRPLQYTYMNYAPPTYQYYRPPPTQIRTLYTPTVVAPPQQYVTYAQPIYYAQPQSTRTSTSVPVSTVAPKQSIGCNQNYLKSPLGLLRLLLIVRSMLF